MCSIGCSRFFRRHSPPWTEQSVVTAWERWLWWLFQSLTARTTQKFNAFPVLNSNKCFWAKWEESCLSDIVLSSSVVFKCFKWWSLTVQRLKGNQNVSFNYIFLKKEYFQIFWYHSTELCNLIIRTSRHFSSHLTHICVLNHPLGIVGFRSFDALGRSQVGSQRCRILVFHALLVWNMFVCVSALTLDSGAVFKCSTLGVERFLVPLSSSSHSSCDVTKMWNLFFVSSNIDDFVEISTQITLTWNV